MDGRSHWTESVQDSLFIPEGKKLFEGEGRIDFKASSTSRGAKTSKAGVKEVNIL